MSMAEKRRKLLEAKGQGALARPAALSRAPIMVLAADVEVEEPKLVPDPQPTSREAELEARPEAPLPDNPPVDQHQLPQGAVGVGGKAPTSSSKTARQAKVAPRRSAEAMGATLETLLHGLEARGISRRTVKASIPYSLRLDTELFGLLRAGEESSASQVLEAFHTVPRDNLDTIAGAASLVAERRRRPSRGGLGQAGTVTINLDGVGSQTLEVLAKRARLSCAAFLEGSVLIWSVGKGLLRPDAAEKPKLPKK